MMPQICSTLIFSLNFLGTVIPSSLNFGMRRTWTDIVKSLALIYVRATEGESVDLEMANASHYDFGDFNLKLTHRFSRDSKLSFSAYYGQDFAKSMIITQQDEESDGRLKFNLIWGNTLGTLRWERRWSETLLMAGVAWTSPFSYTPVPQITPISFAPSTQSA